MANGISSGISFGEYVKKRKEEEEQKKLKGSAPTSNTTSNTSSRPKGLGASSGISFEEYMAERLNPNKKNLTTAEVNDWFKKVQTVSVNLSKYDTKKYTTDFGGEDAKTVNSLLSNANDVRRFLITNPDLDPDGKVWQSYESSLKHLQNSQKAINDANDYFSQWESELKYDADMLEEKLANADVSEMQKESQRMLKEILDYKKTHPDSDADNDKTFAKMQDDLYEKNDDIKLAKQIQAERAESKRQSDLLNMSSAEIKAEWDKAAPAASEDAEFLKKAMPSAYTNDDIPSMQMTEVKIAYKVGGNEYKTTIDGLCERYGVKVDDFLNDKDVFTEVRDKIKAGESSQSQIAFTTADGQNVTWQQLYDDAFFKEDLSKRYFDYSSNADWEQNSKAIQSAEDINKFANKSDHDTLVWLQEISHIPYTEEKALHAGTSLDTYKKIAKARQEMTDKYGVDLTKEFGTDASVLVNLTDPAFAGKVFYDFDQLTPTEKEIFSYIWTTEGPVPAYNWYVKNEKEFIKRSAIKDRQEAMAFGEEHPWLASGQSLLTNIGSGFEFVGDYMQSNTTGRPQYNTLANTTSSLRGGVMEGTDWEIGDWDAFDFLYGTGMSAADSVLMSYVPGGHVILAGSAAAQGYNDAIDRGLSQGQAFATGFANGVAEGFFEKWSIGKFKALKEVPSAAWKDISLNVLKSMGVNASEEAATEIANLLYDSAVNGDFSQYETNVRMYEAQGYSTEEAQTMAFKKEIYQVAESGLSGLVMGAGFGVIGGARPALYNISSSYQNSRANSNVAKGTISANGGTAALRNLSNKVAGVSSPNMQSKLNKQSTKVGDNASVRNVKNLYKTIGKATNALNQADIAKSLERNGFSAKEANAVAGAIVASQRGQLLSNKQSTLLEKYRDNKDVNDAIENIVLNSQSTMGQRNSDVTDFARSAALGIPFNASAETTSQSAEGKSVSKPKNVTQSKFESNTEGETINTKTGETVVIKTIADISESGEANLTLDDGAIVKASDLSFGSSAEAMFIENIEKIKIGKNAISTNAANALYQTAMSALKDKPKMTASEADALIKGLTESYVYGSYDLGMEKLTQKDERGSTRLFAGDLTQKQRAFAYDLGFKERSSRTDNDQNAIAELVARAETSAERDSKGNVIPKIKKGKIVFEDGVGSLDSLPSRQRVSIEVGLRLIAEVSPIEFHIFQSTKGKDGQYSYVLKNGKKIGANGFYVVGTNQIWVDVNAASFSEGTMLWTVAHEISHYIRQWSPAKWQVMADFIVEQYKKEGKPVEKMIEHEVDLIRLREEQAELAAKEKGEEFTPMPETEMFDEGYEEFISNALIRMFDDGSIVKNMAELKKVDKGLWEKICEAIKNLLAKWGLVLDEYKNLSADREAAQPLEQMHDTFKKLQGLLQDAFVDANYVASLVAEGEANANRMVFDGTDVNSGKTEAGVKNQLRNNEAIGQAAIDYNNKHSNVNAAILATGVETMHEMAEAMIPYLDEEGILPPDIPGKTIFKNGSYGRTGENTTLCVRTLTYEDFKDRVAEKIGRPLTVAESLLVSQKIYDIATDPQCIYCYVAADRKAYDEYLGEYWKAMDKYIKALRKGGDSNALYTEYLAGRKDTNQQKKRWTQWEAIAKSGKEYISAKDLTTKRKRDALIAKNNAFSEQIKDAQRYAQSASWAKTVFDYRAYKGDILKMTPKFVNMLNSEYGLRMYSFSDYTPAFIVENMQMIIDASVKGLKSLAYTKDTDYAEIFASTGQAINVSCFAKWDAELGTFVEDNRQGANWQKTKNLRKQYRNVGAVMVATNDAMVEWALKQDWVDVVIPYHIVKTGTTIANEYQWNNYTSESADRVGNKTANIYPTEHNNDFATYSNLLTERGITPRFSKWYDMVASGKLTENQYMKLVNEVRLPASELSPVVPTFNLDAAKNSFGIDNEGKVIKGGFVDKGGYMGGWYRQGVDVNQEVMQVSKDITDGKSSLDVDYGMNKKSKEKVAERYGIKSPAVDEMPMKLQARTSSYDFSKSFEQQVDDYKNGVFPQNDTLVVGGTPKIWQSIGFNALPVTINQTHVDYALNGTKDADHHIGEKLLKDLPKAIQNPLAIIQSQSKGHESRAVVVFEMDHNGKKVIGAVEVDGQGRTNNIRIDSNAMATLFAKGNVLTQLKTAINNTVNGSVELFYWQKNKAISLLQGAGLQLPSGLPQDGFVHSITEQGSKVKPKYSSVTETQQFRRWFGDWLNNLKKSSKVVNKDGTPRIVYHYTDSMFEEFDTSKSGSNQGQTHGDGIYVSTSPDEFSYAGKYRMEFYANIRNPFEMQLTDKQAKYVLEKYGATKRDIDKFNGEYRKHAMGKLTSPTSVFDYLSQYAEENGIKVSDILKDLKFDGVHDGSEWVVFDSTQLKSATDNIGTFDGTNPKFKYQERTADSNRNLLANSLESAAQNDIERNKLALYKEKISLIEAEEQKLSEIQKQLFTKGGVDAKNRKALQFEAKQIANRINTYDRQLLNLEATTALKNVLNREKALAMKRQKQKDAEYLRNYKEKVAKTQRELLNKWQDSRKKAVEGRNKTALRHKIKGVVGELNQLLLRGTKDKHVMIGLQKAVAEALDAVNMDTVGADERVAKYNALIAKAKDPDVIASLTETRNRIQEQGDKMSGKLTALKNAYNDIKNSDDPLIANSYDEVITSRIESVIEKVGNTPLRDMTLEQLEDVYDMYKMVLTVIRNSNKSFKSAKNESIATLGNRVMMEVEKVGGNHPLSRKVLEGIKSFGWNTLKPAYAFRLIGSDTLTDIYNNVRQGEDTWARDVSEARDFYREKTKKYNFDSWDFKKTRSFTSTSGKNFELSLEQIMSLYAYSKREQADLHLQLGGFVFDSSIEVTKKSKLGIPLKYTVKTADAYNLSQETLGDIIGTLSAEQKAFVDEMQGYLSTVMGEKGNEVSLEMYGVKLFKEKNYFPLKSAKQFMFEQSESAGEVKIKNSGFSKETVAKANNPIILNNFTDVWTNHVNDMSMYHAFVLALEDFNRVYNYKTPTSDNMATESVKMFLQNAYGNQASQYIKQLITDLNGGVRVDPAADPINKGIGAFKKAAVFASASVVIQQPSAIARALSLIDSKYFVTRIGIKDHSKIWSEVKKYAPVAIIKEMGRFDTHIGQQTTDWIKSTEYKGIGQKTKALFTDSAYRDDVLSKAPALADEIAWCYIWNAVKKETKATTKLQVGSEEFLKKCGERFTEIVTLTQVYDSVLSRSGQMRSKDTGMKMATAFMAEPTTSMNMMVDAMIQGKRGNKRYTRKTVGAVASSIILNSILVSLVYAARDDDEDETYTEKYVGSLVSELLDGFNPLTYIPFVKDVWSIAQGYDVERSDMSLYSKLWQSVENLFNENLSAEDKVKDFAGTVLNLFGLPAKNIMRDVDAMFNLTNDFMSGTQTTGAGIIYSIEDSLRNSIPLLGRFYEEDSNAKKLYDAIISGDKVQIERIKSQFKDDKAIESALRKALRENDPRIVEAAQARVNGDIARYTSLVKEIKAEGHFSQDTIVAAINAEINAINKGEGTTQTPAEDKEESIYKLDDLFAAIANGDQASANTVRDDMIRIDVANGKSQEDAEDSFNGRVTSRCREEYEKGNLTGREVEDILVNYGGKTKEEAANKVLYWDFKEDYPDVEMSEEALIKYYDQVESSGISMDVYVDYYEKQKECKGVDANGDGKTDSGSKKAQILKVINSLPISKSQKDTLYFLNGWAKSTLHEAPWH